LKMFAVSMLVDLFRVWKNSHTASLLEVVRVGRQDIYPDVADCLA
jgi:hypothetical protein